MRTRILGRYSWAKENAIAIAGDITVGNGTGTLDTLRLGDLGTGGNQIADTSILTFNGSDSSAGTFQLNDKNETIGGLLSTGGAGVVENRVGSGSSTLTVANTTDWAFSGIIRDGA